MDEKDLKLALSELGDKIDTKLEKYSREITAIADEKARKSALEEIKKALEPELQKFQKLQDQVDGIDTKMKRTSADQDLKKSFAEILKEKLAGGGRELKGKTFQFDMKVDDMTQANSFESTVVVPYDAQAGIKFDPDRTTHARDIISVGTTSSNVV